MSVCPFCIAAEPGSDGTAERPRTSASDWRSSGFVSRGFQLVNWLVPGTILAIVPKCPMCFAAYAAGVTGLGMSFLTATYVRRLLVTVCLGSLVYLAVKSMRRLIVGDKAAIE
jgi:hypothetical protein